MKPPTNFKVVSPSISNSEGSLRNEYTSSSDSGSIALGIEISNRLSP